MLKSLCMFCICFVVGGAGMQGAEKAVCEYLPEVEQIVIYSNSTEFCYAKGEEEFESVMSVLYASIKESREMPAFGVSLDNETRIALKTGVWLELVFGAQKEKGGMAFERLLFQIAPNCYGVNLIRYNNGKYDGRCFYLDIPLSLDRLYKEVLSLI